MNQKPLKSYAEEIPEEIRFMFKGLSSDERLGIIIALLKDGKLTFGQMKKKFGLNSSSLINHLSALQDGNLIKNFYEKKQGRVHSLYDVTDVPEMLFDATFDILLKVSARESIKEKTIESKEEMLRSYSKPHKMEVKPEFNLDNILKMDNNRTTRSSRTIQSQSSE